MTLEWCSNTAGDRALQTVNRKPEALMWGMQLQGQELQLEKEGECPWYTLFSSLEEREIFFFQKFYVEVSELCSVLFDP